MPLEFSKVAAQIEDMVAKAGLEGEERRGRLARALKLFAEADADALIAKVASSKTKTPWPVAGIARGFNRQYNSPPCPQEFTVLATDGSNIDVDRHNSVRCCLINTGTVVIQYGAQPDAQLSSEATILFGDKLVMTDEAGVRTKLIEGLMGIKRSIAECAALADAVAKQPSARTTLAMVDGSLMLWGLSPEDYEGFVREELLDKGYLSSFDRMKKCSIEGSFALCAYTSFPRNAEVMNAMRVYMCGRDSLDCDRCHQEKRKRECDDIAWITDGGLFNEMLDTGQRSAVFSSGWQNVQKYYGEHKISFFYLKAGDEIARVEVPQWVADRDDLINMVHALALDQCRRGQGYPVVLIEAHEKAVVTAADRETFRLLVERAMMEKGMDVQVSGKSRSKRTRWV